MLVELSPQQRKSQGTTSGSPEALRTFRRIWHCDCDGESHLMAGYEKSGPGQSARNFAGFIRELTGYEPHTCPWRAFYDPIVKAVLSLRPLAEDKLIESALGPDPPAVILDAYAMYVRAYNVTRADEMEHERKQREANRQAKH